MDITLIATTIMGFESTLAHELKALGYTDITVHNTKVEFKGSLSDICKANLWLRTAGRVFVKIAEFKATSFDELFDKTQQQAWENWISPLDQFPIRYISSRKSELFSKSDCQAIVKKSIAERLKKTYQRQILPETAATLAIRVSIEHDIVTLSIDSSGAGLNKRGYRSKGSTAPLRETLAAGLILLSRWKADRDVLLDPFCGTGTLLIEAGLIATNTAPGLMRRFASEEWSCIPESLWKNTRQEAADQKTLSSDFRIYGSDHDSRVLAIAQKNIELAGLKDIFVQNRSIEAISSRFDTGKLITNPPYGERLEDKASIESLYTTMGEVLLKQFPQWSYYILTPNEELPFLFKKKPSKKRKLFNGGIQCWYYQYFSNIKKPI